MWGKTTMNSLFIMVLSLTISASALAILLLIFKPLIKNRMPKKIQYLLWIIIIMRLIIPFSLPGNIAHKTIENVGLNANEVNLNNITNIDELETNGVLADTDYNSQHETSVNHNIDLYNVIWIQVFLKYLHVIWLTGAIILMIMNIMSYCKFINLLRENTEAAYGKDIEILNKVYKRSNILIERNRNVSTPMLVGILKPRIIIPNIEYSEEELTYIYCHEISHHRHHDILIKWIVMVVFSIHWFNPLMFIIKKELNRACELACDEDVIKSLSKSERQKYGNILIALAAQDTCHQKILQATLSEDKNNLKERLLAILKYKNGSKKILVISILLVVAVGLLALHLGGGYPIFDNNSIEYVNVNPSYTYNLEEMVKYRTSYVGDNNKVSRLVDLLPLPAENYNQYYISIDTNKEPYTLIVYYEYNNLVQDDIILNDKDNQRLYEMSNAYVLFCMIDNLGEIKFAYRDSPSMGKLQPEAYDHTRQYNREELQLFYGNIDNASHDIKQLRSNLSKPKDFKIEVQEATFIVMKLMDSMENQDEEQANKYMTLNYNQEHIDFGKKYEFGDKSMLVRGYDPLINDYLKTDNGELYNFENITIIRTQGYISGESIRCAFIMVRNNISEPWLVDDIIWEEGEKS